MRLLDLFCGAGGAAVGYHRAGFEVTGIDIALHTDYPFPILTSDAMDHLSPEVLAEFDAVHASPPCPRYSAATPTLNRDRHPDLVGPVREALRAWGGPYVIENVPGAPLENPVVLCGSMFGLGVRRHRLFETNAPMLAPQCRHDLQTRVWGVYGDHGDNGNVYLRPGTGTPRVVKARDAAHAGEVMGIGWMSRWNDLADAIPPAFTEFIGQQLMAHIATERAA